MFIKKYDHKNSESVFSKKFYIDLNIYRPHKFDIQKKTIPSLLVVIYFNLFVLVLSVFCITWKGNREHY